MRLIIVRHGQTNHNVKGVVQGSDVRLNKIGRRQAKKVALKLSREEIDIIFSSDLRRAADTAREIARFHKVPVYYVKELRERNAGEFEGMSHERFAGIIRASGVPLLDFKPEKGESLAEMSDRAGRFAGRICREYKGKTVLLVTHGGVVKALASLYFNTPPEEQFKLRTVNTGVLVLEVTGSRGRKVRDEMFSEGDKEVEVFGRL